MYNGYTEARARANRRYEARFVAINLRITGDERDAIRGHAQSTGESIVGFIRRAIRETMERDKAIT